MSFQKARLLLGQLQDRDPSPYLNEIPAGPIRPLGNVFFTISLR